MARVTQQRQAARDYPEDDLETRNAVLAAMAATRRFAGWKFLG